MDKSDLLRKSLAKIQELKARVEELEAEKREPIAIVGIGARFPAQIRGPRSMWQALLDGVDVITEIPTSRWPQGRAGAEFAGMIEEPYAFAPAFFGISDREARMMDPQQRLMLEVGWDALADAGLPLAGVRGSNTGVYVGAIGQDWTLLACGNPDEIDAYTSTGASHAIIANRLSYVWDLRGPSITVDVACASSLVAVHLATAALRRRECDMALAGGVQLHLAPESTLSLHRFNMMARDGRCKAFDARADGFVRAEGCGAVVLKRLSDALASKDRIYALVSGSAVNQDGRSNGLTAPNALAQATVIRAALSDAKVDPEQVGLIETHGTGTALGDPIEFQAIVSAYGSSGPECHLGAIKTNLGHTEAAAGIAGFIKATLALHHGALPKNLHFQRPNPDLGLEGTRFRIPTTELRVELRHAAVSSFGFGGTNAHVVLSRAPERPARPDADAPHIALLSTHASSEFRERARQLAALALVERSDDLAFTTAFRSTHLSWRGVAVGRTREELAKQLELATPERCPTAKRRVVFLFPGQGGQWVGMARRMSSFPVFRAALDACASSIERQEGWSLHAALESDTELARVDRVQPAIFAMQVATAALWRSFGVTPDVVLGTSMGELAAAHTAGLLGLDDAVRVVTRRSRLIRDKLARPGGMATLALSPDEVARRLARTNSDLEIAVINSPTNVVVAGSPEPLDALVATLHAEGVFARRIQVDYASHCSHVEVLAADLHRELGVLHAGEGPRIPMLSTVSCRWLDDATSTSYWQDNLRAGVRLWPAITDVLRPESDIIVELSPHPVLTIPLADPLSNIAADAHILCGMTRDTGTEVFANALGVAWSLGAPVNWRELIHEAAIVSLPSYPWSRQTFTPPATTRAAGAWVASAPPPASPPPESTDLPLDAFVLASLAHELSLRSVSDLRMDIPLRDLGLDSLMASHLRAALASRDIKLPLLDILQAPSVRSLLDSLGGLQQRSGAAPRPATSSWLTRPRPRPDAAMVCVCFPFGGGSAGAFRAWAEAMPDWLEIRGVEYPGRGLRAGEAWASSFEDIADAVCETILREIDRPFLLYGHCSGTLAAYETTKRLVAAGRPPEHLVVGALRAPAKFNLAALLDVTNVADGVLHEQEDAQLMAFLHAVHFRGVDDIEKDDELRSMALSTLRADSRIAHRYRRVEAEPLPVPITAIGGGEDPSINTYELWAWGSETARGFDWRWFPAGDHYFHSDHIAELTDIFDAIRRGVRHAQPLSMAGLRPLDVVRSFHAATIDGQAAWSTYASPSASWVCHGMSDIADGFAQWFNRMATREVIYADMVSSESESGVTMLARVTVQSPSGPRSVAVREHYRVEHGQIVACESWFEAAR